jgi:hypothetical protein
MLDLKCGKVGEREGHSRVESESGLEVFVLFFLFLEKWFDR